MSKPIPGHKYLLGVTPTCGCGWKGPTYFGRGSRASAAHEWRSHTRTACEAVTPLDPKETL